MSDTTESYISLDTAQPVWDRFFWVSPLVVIGTVEDDGSYDLAPKHMATPLGWKNYFGFVCTPRHATYQNAIREKAFTVSYPRPEQLVETSLTAEPRCDDGQKTSLTALPVVPAELVSGPLLAGAYLHLECELERIVEGFGENGLIVGTIVAARVRHGALRDAERADEELIARNPLLAYLPPLQYTTIAEAHNFPLPAGFER